MQFKHSQISTHSFLANSMLLAKKKKKQGGWIPIKKPNQSFICDLFIFNWQQICKEMFSMQAPSALKLYPQCMDRKESAQADS